MFQPNNSCIVCIHLYMYILHTCSIYQWLPVYSIDYYMIASCALVWDEGSTISSVWLGIFMVKWLGRIQPRNKGSRDRVPVVPDHFTSM
jgi:hypothetical protein